MADSISFQVRACFRIQPDRMYRVELFEGALYFLCTGSQFDVDRGLRGPGGAGKVAAVMLLAAGEALFRSHKAEELRARDPNAHPADLVSIHPYNFKLAPSDIVRATLFPKRWFLALFRRHYGRLVIECADGSRNEYHFETREDLQIAEAHLPSVLSAKLVNRISR